MSNDTPSPTPAPSAQPSKATKKTEDEGVPLVVSARQFPTKHVEIDGVTYHRDEPVTGPRELLERKDLDGRPYLETDPA